MSRKAVVLAHTSPPGAIEAESASPRADLVASALWIAFGAAVAIGAWRMDRLERLSINPYEAPGLVPGLLGTVLVVLGLALALRALRRGGLAPTLSSAVAGEGALPRARPEVPALAAGGRGGGVGRMALVFALTLAYALLLIGTGLPFWGATFIFVSVFVGLLDADRQRTLGRSRAAQWTRAAVYGAAWSAIVTLSFQYIFLVRLP